MAADLAASEREATREEFEIIRESQFVSQQRLGDAALFEGLLVGTSIAARTPGAKRLAEELKERGGKIRAGIARRRTRRQIQRGAGVRGGGRGQAIGVDLGGPRRGGTLA